jgi:hypothetical protein
MGVIYVRVTESVKGSGKLPVTTIIRDLSLFYLSPDKKHSWKGTNQRTSITASINHVLLRSTYLCVIMPDSGGFYDVKGPVKG